jgi:hypothetical protein
VQNPAPYTGIGLPPSPGPATTTGDIETTRILVDGS